MPAHGRRPSFTGARHEQHRAARRLGAGWVPSAVARVLDCDSGTIHLLLRDREFVELYRAFLDLAHLPPEDRLAKLEELALVLLEEGVADGDRRVAAFVVHERRLGRNPAATLAKGIAAAAERDAKAAEREEAPAPPPPEAKPRPPADPAAGALWRTAAKLRGSVIREHAARLEPLPAPPAPAPRLRHGAGNVAPPEAPAPERRWPGAAPQGP